MRTLPSVEEIVLRTAGDGAPVALAELRGRVTVLVISRHLG